MKDTMFGAVDQSMVTGEDKKNYFTTFCNSEQICFVSFFIEA